MRLSVDVFNAYRQTDISDNLITYITCYFRISYTKKAEVIVYDLPKTPC